MISFISDTKELTVKDDVLLTKQVATFKNFKIKGDISVSFTVPNNSVTRDALGYYGYNQIDSPIFTENYFSMVRNGNTIAIGKLVIEQDTGEELSLFFISGNGNWFNLFQFSCKDIRNQSLQMQANFRSREISWGVTTGGGSFDAIIDSPPRDYGIVFPLIDPAFKNQRYNYYLSLGVQFRGGSSLPNASVSSIERGDASDLIPCLYLHTLVNEISKVADVQIIGNIFDDKFFKSIILTPESYQLYDQDTEELCDIVVASNSQSGGGVVKIEMIAPNMKAIDLIKWICVSFGCSPIYDTRSKTLTLDQIDKINDSEDWSAYLKSYTIYNDVYQNNYIRYSEGSDQTLKAYNEVNDIKFGDLNIESDKTDGSFTDVYKSPFYPCFDSVHNKGDNTFSTFIPFVELEDEDSFAYTSVTNSAGKAVFTGTGFPFSADTDLIILRIVDDNGIYDGYHYQNGLISPTDLIISTQSDFISDSTGIIFIQRLSYGSPGTRALSVIPRINANQFTNQSALRGANNLNYPVVMTAYFSKPYTIYPLLNGMKQGLSYGEVSDRIDITLQEKYLKNISKAIQKPRLRANMILPESVFQKFNFDKFVYLNTGKLNGYFLVESIVNYKDGMTLVEVNLYGN